MRSHPEDGTLFFAGHRRKCIAFDQNSLKGLTPRHKCKIENSAGVKHSKLKKRVYMR